MCEMENLLDKANKIVVKVGTAGITTDSKINSKIIANLAKCCHELRMQGKCVTIVTSGAIASGKRKLHTSLEGSLVEKQVYAAVGQPLLMQEYILEFGKYGVNIAQFLVTKNDFVNKERFKILYGSYNKTLEKGVVPVFNENDTLATREIKFSDNDELEALITTRLGQDLMVNLIIHDGLLKDGEIVETADSYSQEDYDNIKNEMREGRGGLQKKLDAIKMANDAGKICRIGNAAKSIIGILQGKVLSTTFYPH